MKKIYKKPFVHSNQKERMIIPAALAAVGPAIAGGAALAGGYVIGRVVKQIEVHNEVQRLPAIEKVHCI